MEEYLEATDIKSGPLFRNIHKNGYLLDGLSAIGIQHIFKNRCNPVRMIQRSNRIDRRLNPEIETAQEALLMVDLVPNKKTLDNQSILIVLFDYID